MHPFAALIMQRIGAELFSMDDQLSEAWLSATLNPNLVQQGGFDAKQTGNPDASPPIRPHSVSGNSEYGVDDVGTGER